MATVAELLKRTNFMVSDNITADIAITFFNECLEELALSVKNTKSIDIPMEARDKTFTLPDDHLQTIRMTIIKDNRKIQVSNQSDDTEYQYREIEKEITIEPVSVTPYTVRLDYYASIPLIGENDLNAVPAFPAQFHRLLSLYLAARYYENWEGDPASRQNFQIQYEAVRQEFRYEMNKKELKNKSKQVQQFVSWT